MCIGDPTVFGNLNVPDQVDEALIASIKSHKWNGYAHSAGFPSARKAIATRFGQETAPLTEDDVVIASGCSGALEMAIGALVNPGNNFLIPAPGFSLYQTILNYKNIEPRFYKLKVCSKA
jgi:tyrosine aminotransferase